MKNLRPIAFVIANTNHGSMLINRFDYRLTKNGGYGVGYQILNTSSFDAREIDLAVNLLNSRRKNFGDGVVAIDCGANVGVHTIEWAQAMHGWGEVIAFEAQERIFYALAGNVTLNNCFNARVVWAAVGAENGEILVPSPDYFTPASFGSLEIRKRANTEFIGQDIDYSGNSGVKTKLVRIDDLDLKRLDLIKIDIEGMELEALQGAEQVVDQFKPQMIIEKIKANEEALRAYLTRHGYLIFALGINLLAIHPDDPASKQITVNKG